MSQAEKSTGRKVRCVSMPSALARTDGHGVRGRGQMGLCHADPCTEPLDQLPWCPGVRGRILEAAGQGLQDQCSSLKLKTVSRQDKFLVSTEK